MKLSYCSFNVRSKQGEGGEQGEREAQRHTYEEIIACAIALRPFVSALK